MIELAARHLHAQKLGQMIIANRSLNRAQRLAETFKASAISLDALDSHLAQADIVISSTASPDHVIGFEATRNATARRRRRPIFMLDLAVPRDIDPRVAELEDVYLFTIDDLRQVVDVNVRARQEEAETARAMVAAEVERYVADLKVRDAAPLIRELRGQAEIARAQTLEQARRMLASGRPPDDVLEFLAATLTNRLLHGPSMALREVAESGDAELAALAARLFRLGNDAP
jgi:glutamyl-tRNA reductase